MKLPRFSYSEGFSGLGFRTVVARYWRLAWGRFELQFTVTTKASLKMQADAKVYADLKARALAAVPEDDRWEVHFELEAIWGDPDEPEPRAAAIRYLTRVLASGDPHPQH